MVWKGKLSVPQPVVGTHQGIPMGHRTVGEMVGQKTGIEATAEGRAHDPMADGIAATGTTVENGGIAEVVGIAPVDGTVESGIGHTTTGHMGMVEAARIAMSDGGTITGLMKGVERTVGSGAITIPGPAEIGTTGTAATVQVDGTMGTPAATVATESVVAAMTVVPTVGPAVTLAHTRVMATEPLLIHARTRGMAISDRGIWKSSSYGFVQQ